MMFFLGKIRLNSYFKTPRKIKVFGPVKLPCTIQASGHQAQAWACLVQVCMVVPTTVFLFMEVFISHQVLIRQTFQFTLAAPPTRLT